MLIVALSILVIVEQISRGIASNSKEMDSSVPVNLASFSYNDDLTLEIGLFMDDAMYKTYTANFTDTYAEKKLKDYVSALMHDIQILYKNPYLLNRISIKIVHYEVFKKQPDRLTKSYVKDWNALSYLNEFCTYQSRLPDRNWDHSILLTGNDLTYTEMGNKISGLTRVGGVCEAENACTVLEGFDFSAALVGAHEIAHALGVNHDEPNCDSTHIMAQSLGPGRIGWSSCSIRELRTAMSKLDEDGRNCLRETIPRKSALELDGLPLPGIQFNANDQCALVFSPNHRQRPVPREASDNICHMMFCGLGYIGPIISSNPALEGTICGEGKYCQYGQCIPFPSGINGYPVSVNGQWSSWSSIDCGQCTCGPVLGSIGVVASSRTCSNPKPTDGGRDCQGSKSRGSICREHCPYAKFTSKSYVRRVCQDRKRRSFDYALMGIGIQLVDSPCKIRCHARETRIHKRGYRYFGDFMPNGSPCGPRSYCVNGECMPLNCNNEALSDDNSSCPTNGWDICRKNEDDRWDQWTDWTSCSVTCGTGSRNRQRECKGLDCKTKVENQWQPCESTMCLKEDDYRNQWSKWSEWTQCSSTCDRSGKIIRSRSCNGTKCPIAQQQETRDCFTLLRGFDDCPDPDAEWSTWSQWSTCSKSCGQGTTTRNRFCTKQKCPGSAKEIRACKNATCAYRENFGPWSDFEPCTVSCGLGIRVRRRKCNNSQSQTICRAARLSEEQPCFTRSCYQWSGWSFWSNCRRDPFGQDIFRRRIRGCFDYNGTQSSNCIGNFFDEELC